MTFRKIPLTFLILTIGVSFAYAKKQPKYEQARQLTADQASLVQKAIAQEKVLIKNIQQRTPLVETYIQDTRPDVKLYEVPIADHYMLSRVDFGKAFYDKTYTPKEDAKKGFFKGSLASITGLTKALGLDTHFTYSAERLHADDVPRSVGVRPAALCLQLCAERVSRHGAHRCV